MRILAPTTSRGFAWRAGAAFLLACLLAGWFGCARHEAGSTALPPSPDFSGFPAALKVAVARAEAGIERTPRDAPAWMQLGQLYHANGFDEQARRCYEELVGKKDVGARACYFLARIMEASSDLAGEQHWLQETLRLEPTYIPARLLLAETCFKSGDPAVAAAGFRAVLASDPVNTEALIGMARERIRLGDDAGAAEILEKLTAEHPKFSTGFALLAQVVERSGDVDRAAGLREKARARKDPPRADPWMDELLPSCFDVQQLGMRFEDYVKAGRGEEAWLYLRRLEAVDPASPIVCRMRALAAVQQGRPADAVREYERALAAGGEPSIIYPALIETLVEMKRFAEAEARARAGLQVEPRSAALLAALGEVRWKQGDRDEAVRHLSDALALDPQNLAANRALARIHWEAGRRSQAVAHLEIVRRLAPTDVAARAMLGEYFLEARRPAEALAPLREARGLAPENESAVELLALAHVRTGNQLARDGTMPAALAAYDRAIVVRPATAEAHANKVQILLRLGDVARADAALQAWLALQPEEPAAWVMLGDVQHAGGQVDASRRSWTRAQSLLAAKPNDVLQQLITQRLQ